ncbi:NgoFVII family restriction endonuclease [Leptotrichia sp. OH3620_COT-345]|uniref:phospholipase D-like domain-containing protein n=1 Tax=Leptotrichia sp. OH3620_COT-345 TaxID=2491048 RepID=UPI000F64809A|nr:phospholipase D-like domain-containing protein [Leptotrichia sp. OH3620_COT-345]RRD40387.1 NgoFVII family restriction endonuclease [Leptotrichia sp. OH3620_COT-345]
MEEKREFIDHKDPNVFYVAKNYSIILEGITADIKISKGMCSFIKEKLSGKSNFISSFKAIVPYIDLEYINKTFNLSSSEKLFIISSKEIYENNDEVKIRRNKNRKYLESKIKYTSVFDINGKKKLSKEFTDKTLNLITFKYNSKAKDIVRNEKNFFNIHSKIFLINNEFAFIGSANLTSNALTNNYETLFFIDKNKSSENKIFIDKLIEFFNNIQNEKNIETEEIFFNDQNIQENNNIENDIKNLSFIKKLKLLFSK